MDYAFNNFRQILNIPEVRTYCRGKDESLVKLRHYDTGLGKNKDDCKTIVNFFFFLTPISDFQTKNETIKGETDFFFFNHLAIINYTSNFWL